MEKLEEQIYELCEALGYEVVELHIAAARGGGKRIVVYIYSAAGIGSDDCEKASRALLPRAEALLEGQPVELEISSPGISRTFKSPKEYRIFTGKNVRAVLHNGETIEGLLGEAGSQDVQIGERRLEYSQIAKCRLI